MPIGGPWVPGSTCDPLLISLPSLHDPGRIAGVGAGHHSETAVRGGELGDGQGDASSSTAVAMSEELLMVKRLQGWVKKESNHAAALSAATASAGRRPGAATAKTEARWPRNGSSTVLTASGTSAATSSESGPPSSHVAYRLREVSARIGSPCPVP